MRVVVFGATGNVGSALVRALRDDPAITSLIGVARRAPLDTIPVDEFIGADISCDPLDEIVQGADVVVHLAWLIQPGRRPDQLWATNVEGTRRVVEAALGGGVPKLVYASSVGAYGPGPKRPVDETHPTTGISTSLYSRHKAAVEAMLDELEARHADLALVRMRTSLVFQRDASSEVHRLFMGAFLPWHLPRPLRLVPDVRRLQFQATHADDIADAYRRAVITDVRGPFNIAASPVLDPPTIASAVGGRTIPMTKGLLRAMARASYAARVQPSEVGWLDMALQTPLLGCDRAADLLGWRPLRSSVEALQEILDGIGEGAGARTVPLEPRRARR